MSPVGPPSPRPSDLRSHEVLVMIGLFRSAGIFWYFLVISRAPLGLLGVSLGVLRGSWRSLADRWESLEVLRGSAGGPWAFLSGMGALLAPGDGPEDMGASL